MSNLSINETVNETVNIPTNEKVSNNQLVNSDDDSEEELPKKGLVGLNNQGNTCYLNSVIQTLSNLDYFRNYLFEGNFIQSLKPELDDSLFYQTYRIIKHLWETTSNDLTPKSFRKKFIEKENQFMGYNQQDSQEAMQFIIDNLHEEIAQSIEINSEIKPEYEAFFKLCDNYYENQAKIDVNDKNNGTSNDKSILKLIDANPTMALDYFALKFYKELSKKYSEISELFQSIVCELNKCPDCNHISYRFQQNFMIQLDFPELDDSLILESEQYKKFFEEKKEELKEKNLNEELISKFCINIIKDKYIYKLNDLLDNFQKVEQLGKDNTSTCDCCEKRVSKQKQHKLYKYPKYLIFHLKRFKHIMNNGESEINKVKNLVGYDEIININNMLIKPGKSTSYKLVGGINHIGAYEFGHFTNFSKNNNKWYNFNDDRVNEINCNGVPISPNAYMLIYEQIEDSE